MNTKKKENNMVGIVKEVLQQDVFYGFCFANKEEREKFTATEKIVTLIGIASVSLAVNMYLNGSQRLEYYVCQCMQQNETLNFTNTLDYQLMDEDVLELFKETCPLSEEEIEIKDCCHELVWEHKKERSSLINYDPCSFSTVFIDAHKVFSRAWFYQQIYQSAIVAGLSFASLIILVQFVLRLRCDHCNWFMYFLVLVQMVIACVVSIICISLGPKNYFLDMTGDIAISCGLTIFLFNPVNALLLKLCIKMFRKQAGWE